MSTDNALSRLQRFLLLVPWLVAHPGATIRETAEKFGVSGDQIRNDLRDICDSETPGLFFDDTVRIVYWRSDDGIDDDCAIFVNQALRFDRPSRIAAGVAAQLVLGLDVLAQIMGTPSDAVRTARAKLTNIAPDVSVAPVKVQDKGIASETMQCVLRALATRSCIEVDYLAGGRDEVTTRIIEPLTLLTDAGLTRMVSWCHSAEALRTFRLDRILAARPSDASPQAPSKVVDTESFVQSAALNVTATAAKASAWVFDGLPGVEIDEKNAVGQVRATFPAGSMEWAVRWALAHCDVVSVTEPAHLREEVVRRAALYIADSGHSGLPPE